MDSDMAEAIKGIVVGAKATWARNLRRRIVCESLAGTLLFHITSANKQGIWHTNQEPVLKTAFPPATAGTSFLQA